MTDKDKILDDFFNSLEPKLKAKTIDLLKPHLKVLCFPKKHVLLRENQFCNKIYLMCKGASRSYYIHNGIEIHTWFAFEDEVVGSLRNFNGQASKENIELIEDSVLISFYIPEIKSLMKKHIEVANFVNKTILEHALFMEDKFFDFHMKTAQEKFAALLNHEPKIFQRVPLTFIASYLGISRETLSRLRAN